MWIFFVLVGGGLRRVLARRVAETAPPPYYSGVTFLDALLLGIYLSAAPMASTDAPSTRGRRAPSRVVRASRPLLRRARARSVPTRAFLVFYLSRADGGAICKACGFWCFAKTTKAVLSGPLLAFWGRGEQNNSDVVAASHGRVLNRQRQPLYAIAAETAAPTAQELRTRRGVSAVPPR